MEKILKRILIILGIIFLFGIIPFLDIWMEITNTFYYIYYISIVVIGGIILIFYLISMRKKAEKKEPKKILITPEQAKIKFIDLKKIDENDPEEFVDLENMQITAGNPNNPTSIAVVFGQGYHTLDYYYYFINEEDPTIDFTIKSERKLEMNEIKDYANNMSNKPQITRQKIVKRYGEAGEVTSELSEEITEQEQEVIKQDKAEDQKSEIAEEKQSGTN